MKTFKCNFGRGVSCEVKVSDSKPEKLNGHILNAVWTGEPGKRTMRPYIAWMNSVNTMLANEWNSKLMHIFKIRPGKVEDSCEVWVYAPGKPPELVHRPGGKILK